MFKFNTVGQKLFLSIVVCAMVFIGIFSLLFYVGFDKFAVWHTERSLVNVYKNINYYYCHNTEKMSAYLDELNNTSSARVYIVSNGIVVFSGVPSYEYPSSFGSPSGQKTPFSLGSRVVLDGVTLSDEEPYRVFINESAGNGDASQLFLIGLLDNGDNLLLTIPIPIIYGISEISGLFMVFAGMIAFLICCLITYLVARRFSSPLIEMRDIAQKMTQLDFTSRYTGDEEDEVGQLGQSINFLSSQLKDTISRLQETNARLEVEIEKERKIDSMRKDFIINVSHELKTPLAIISGYAEGLKVNINDAPEDKDFYCSVILEESERMRKMVQQLLSLAKMEGGAMVLEREVFNVREFSEGIKNKIAILAETGEITMEFDIADCNVSADQDLTEQVLMNLLSNAINHSPKGGYIRLTSLVMADKLRVFVFNRGDSIPEEDLENIWNSFYKVDKAHTRAYGGTGVGLSIVKAAMLMHNNKYGVENKQDGVEFYFDLDIANSDTKTDDDLLQ